MNMEKKLVSELKRNEQIVQVVALDDLLKERAAHKDAAKTVGGLVAPAIDAVTAGKLIQELGLKQARF